MNQELTIRNKKFRIKPIIRDSLFIIRKSEGFTLIELLLVISIISIIGTFSAVFFSRFLTQNAVSNTQDQFIGQIRKAQIYAMMGKQNGRWGVHFAENTITLFQGNSYIARNTAFDEKFSVNANISTSFSDIVFEKTTGLPVGWAGPPQIYTITGSDSSRQFTINSQGAVSR